MPFGCIGFELKVFNSQYCFFSPSFLLLLLSKAVGLLAAYTVPPPTDTYCMGGEDEGRGRAGPG